MDDTVEDLILSYLEEKFFQSEQIKTSLHYYGRVSKKQFVPIMSQTLTINIRRKKIILLIMTLFFTLIALYLSMQSTDSVNSNEKRIVLDIDK
jgi:hypothetical protein